MYKEKAKKREKIKDIRKHTPYSTTLESLPLLAFAFVCSLLEYSSPMGILLILPLNHHLISIPSVPGLWPYDFSPLHRALLNKYIIDQLLFYYTMDCLKDGFLSCAHSSGPLSGTASDRRSSNKVNE